MKSVDQFIKFAEIALQQPKKAGFDGIANEAGAWIEDPNVKRDENALKSLRKIRHEANRRSNRRS